MQRANRKPRRERGVLGRSVNVSQLQRGKLRSQQVEVPDRHLFAAREQRLERFKDTSLGFDQLVEQARGEKHYGYTVLFDHLSKPVGFQESPSIRKANACSVEKSAPNLERRSIKGERAR